MRTLLILAVLSLITASSTGCFHRQACCGVGSGGLFGWRQQQQPAYQQCCDPCAPVAAPVMSAPCCP